MADNSAGLPSLDGDLFGQIVQGAKSSMDVIQQATRDSELVAQRRIEQAQMGAAATTKILSDSESQVESLLGDIAKEYGALNSATQRQGEILSQPAFWTNLKVLAGDESSSLQKAKADEEKSTRNIQSLTSKVTAVRDVAKLRQDAIAARVAGNKEMFDAVLDRNKGAVEMSLKQFDMLRQAQQSLYAARSEGRAAQKHAFEMKDLRKKGLSDQDLMQGFQKGGISLGGVTLTQAEIREEMQRREKLQLELQTAELGVKRGEVGLAADQLDLGIKRATAGATVSKAKTEASISEINLADKEDARARNQAGHIISNLLIGEINDVLKKQGVYEWKDAEGNKKQVVLPIDLLQSAQKDRRVAQQEQGAYEAEVFGASADLASLGPMINNVRNGLTLINNGNIPAEIMAKEVAIHQLLEDASNNKAMNPEVAKMAVKKGEELMQSVDKFIDKTYPEKQRAFHKSVVATGTADPKSSIDYIFDTIQNPKLTGLTSNDPRAAADAAGRAAIINRLAKSLDMDVGSVDEMSASEIMGLMLTQAKQNNIKPEQIQHIYASAAMNKFVEQRRQAAFRMAIDYYGMTSGNEVIGTNAEITDAFAANGITFDKLREVRNKDGKPEFTWDPRMILRRLSEFTDPNTGQRLDHLLLQHMSSSTFQSAFQNVISSPNENNIGRIAFDSAILDKNPMASFHMDIRDWKSQLDINDTLKKDEVMDSRKLEANKIRNGALMKNASPIDKLITIQGLGDLQPGEQIELSELMKAGIKPSLLGGKFGSSDRSFGPGGNNANKSE